MNAVAAPILAVDDSASMRRMLAHTLRQGGYAVVEACDGLEALALARSQPFGLVITDQNMPRMDGIELTGALRALPDLQDLPILILSTESDPEVRGAARAAGATGWMLKPFDPQRLLDVIRHVTSPKEGTVP